MINMIDKPFKFSTHQCVTWCAEREQKYDGEAIQIFYTLEYRVTWSVNNKIHVEWTSHFAYIT